MIVKFCIECGSKIVENAKFCYECGTNVSLIKVDTKQDSVVVHNNDDEASRKLDLREKEEVVARNKYIERFIKSIEKKVQNETKSLSIIKGVEFNISGNNICFDRDLIEYNKLRTIFFRLSKNYKVRFIYEYNKNVKSLEYLLDTQISTILSYINQAALEAVTVLLTNNIDFVDKSKIVEHVIGGINFEEFIEPIMIEVAKVEDYITKLSYNREITRSSRSHWQGGGFGLSGALKGAVTAGALNMGTGIFRGIGDSITNSFDKSKINKMKIAIYENPKTVEYLSEAVFNFTFRVFEIVYRILVKEKNLRMVKLGYNIDLYESQVKNYIYTYYKYKTGYDKLIKSLCNCIQSNPYNLNYYVDLYTTFDQPKGKILEMASFFGLREEYLDTILQNDKWRIEYIQKMDESTPEAIGYIIDSYYKLYDDIPICEFKSKIIYYEEKKKELENEALNNPPVDSIISKINLEQIKFPYKHYAFDSVDFWKETDVKASIISEVFVTMNNSINKNEFDNVIKEINGGNMYASYIYEKFLLSSVFQNQFKETDIEIDNLKATIINYFSDKGFTEDNLKYFCERIMHSILANREVHYDNNSPNDIKQLMNNGNILAAVFIGVLIIDDNEKFKYSKQDGVKILTKTAELFHPDSIYRIGIYFFKGLNGFSKDLDKAEKLLTLSALYGVGDSVKYLEELQYIINYKSKFCVDCGEENEQIAIYCEGCGAAFDE